MFTNMVSEGIVMEVGDSTCNRRVSANAAKYTVRLPPYPTVSCRITPTGDTLLNFQWGNN